MPVTHSEHTLRQHPCGFLRGNCAVLQDSAVPDTPQTCSESLSVVCGFCAGEKRKVDRRFVFIPYEAGTTENGGFSGVYCSLLC